MTALRVGLQDHLRAAPRGLGARALWGVSGGRGARLWVLEHGWSTGHEALRDAAIGQVGWPSCGPKGHGTRALGVLVGRSAAVGDGLAPRARVGVSGVFDGDRFDPAGALAALQAAPGDVVLVMAQSPDASGRGVVCQEGHAEVEVLAARGVHVVLPAGNGGADLADVAAPAGAVVVGACTLDAPHSPLPTSSFGARVDAWAPGERVAAIDAGRLGERPAGWTASFSGTSAAAAQIAGFLAAALSVRALDPAEARAWLRDPALGTPVAGLGWMPDGKRWAARLRRG